MEPLPVESLPEEPVPMDPLPLPVVALPDELPDSPLPVVPVPVPVPSEPLPLLPVVPEPMPAPVVPEPELPTPVPEPVDVPEPVLPIDPDPLLPEPAEALPPDWACATIGIAINPDNSTAINVFFMTFLSVEARSPSLIERLTDDLLTFHLPYQLGRSGAAKLNRRRAPARSQDQPARHAGSAPDQG